MTEDQQVEKRVWAAAHDMRYHVLQAIEAEIGRTMNDREADVELRTAAVEALLAVRQRVRKLAYRAGPASTWQGLTLTEREELEERWCMQSPELGHSLMTDVEDTLRRKNGF